MKVFCLSNRFYYRDLDKEDSSCIKNDLKLYNSMLHKAYKLLYDKKYKGSVFAVSLQKQLKDEFKTNDYFPLSVINEAKALLRSNESNNLRLQKQSQKKINKIKYKIRLKQSELNKWSKEKEELIIKCKEMNYTEKDYLYEVQVVNPKIKMIKNNIQLLKFRLNRENYHLESLKKTKSVCFGGRNNLKNNIELFRINRKQRMLIPGRRQGKYSNNLFKYHIDEGVMIYRSTAKDIKLPITFHKHHEELEKAVRMKHNTEGKAVAYELKDYGEYFIIKAIIEYQQPQVITTKAYGSIGVDINADHLALVETDMNGNLIKAQTYKMNLKRKTRNQRQHIQYEVISKIARYCTEQRKSLIVEDLNFQDKKMNLLYEDKRHNQMISEFAYKGILEKIERKCIVEGIGFEKVNPAYTSQIGKLKYAKRLGISIHHSAAYCIARRGCGYVEKANHDYFELTSKTKNNDKWKDIIKVLEKATLRECQYTPYMCIFR